MTRRLHIGGTVRKAGWEVLNALPGNHVDHLGNAKDLSRFQDGTFVEIYGSHVLEHFDYARELIPVLREWRRVMHPSGRLLISVPDLDVLCELFTDRQRLSPDDRFHVMRMMFGGHVDQYDFHYVGLNEEILARHLKLAGFVACQRIDSMGLFNDTSAMQYAGRPISLNLQAFAVWPPEPSAIADWSTEIPACL